MQGAVPSGSEFGEAGCVEPVWDGFSHRACAVGEAESWADPGGGFGVCNGLVVEVVGGEEAGDVVVAAGGWLVLEEPEQPPVTDEVVDGRGEGRAVCFCPFAMGSECRRDGL